jgi:uncharacterized protein YqeY
MPELKQRIVEDMKSAMKAKDKEGLKAIRMILGAIKQRDNTHISLTCKLSLE